MTTSTPVDFQPMANPHRDDPHLYYRLARDAPVALSPSFGAYMVSRYDDLMAVIDDPETFSSSASVPSIYHNPPEVVAELEGHVPEAGMLVNEDPPGHTATRTLFDAGFTGARVRALAPLMHSRSAELIDAFDGGSADLVADYAGPFVETIVNAVVGFPADDAPRIRAWSVALTLLFNPLAPIDGKVEAARSMRDYADYLRDLIATRRAERRDDVVSDLVHGTPETPPLSDEHAMDMLWGARVAGLDTTRDSITSTVLLLLQDPSLREVVTSGHPRMLSKVIEETLRRDAPHRGLMRVTTREVELGGTLLPAGAALLLLFGSGNRDETKFPRPDDVDIDRPNVRDHLAFGTGLHVCPGAPLARAEIRIAVEALLQALPTLRLADGFRPRYIASYLFRGLEELPVTWR